MADIETRICDITVTAAHRVRTEVGESIQGVQRFDECKWNGPDEVGGSMRFAFDDSLEGCREGGMSPGDYYGD